ncbi:MAG TPA: helix-turn-helix transcriptional regulator [Polyangiaceae bacterium]|nr:helix-turn-helix transcriptional regulator [Polyangiaceae bacterium]
MTPIAFTSDRLREITRSAYAFGRDLAAWADGVHEALGPSLDFGQGTLVSVVEFPERGVRVLQVASRGGAGRVHRAIVRLSALLAPDKLRESFFNGRVLGASSGHYGDAEFARMQASARRASSRDAAGFCVNDGVDHGFMLVAPARELLRFPTQPTPAVRRLGSHIATGLRLQRVLASAALDDPSVEAILDPEGRPQHSVGMARMRGTLERLREVVLARARIGDDISVDPAWSAVLGGRWSLVDRFDSDGRRYVVAYRNPPGVLDPRRLTPREEGVTALAAIGRSNKEIASELGVTPSTVATLLGAALEKLGLESRTMLPLFWRDLHGRAWAVNDAEAPLIALSHGDDPDSFSALTPAERAVALALLRGLSDRNIAQARNSSRHTVSKHVSAIYKKLGVSSRVELAYKLSLARAATDAAHPAPTDAAREA